MSINIGLDIGGVSLKMAAIGTEDDRPLMEQLTRARDDFFAAQFPADNPLAGRPLVLSRYRRIQGSPIQSTFDLLKEFYEHVPEQRVEGIRVTGSGSQLIARILGIYFENEFRAIAKGVRVFYPEVRTVFEMGGESSKYIRLEPTAKSKYLGIVDYSSSGDCAAGTGSFIDQQATRLLYKIEEVGKVATTGQILRGLCDAVSRNFKSAIVKGREVVPPVAFIGAVGLNQGVRNAMQEAFKLEDGQFFVPQLNCWMGALGAAMFEAEEWRKKTFKKIHQLKQHAGKQVFAGSDPLSMAKVNLLRDHVKDPPLPPPGQKIPAYLGIDIGSVSTNLVVIDE